MTFLFKRKVAYQVI